MIAAPHNDRACLDAITAEVVALVESQDPALTALAEEHGSPEVLVAWIRSLPQRDDDGAPCDGPRVKACRPPQRLRIPADDPNCVERAALYLGAAELLDTRPVRRLATTDTPEGLHTFPTEDGEPVILDPHVTRNALRAGLFRDRRARNGCAPLGLTPGEAVDWLAELAAEPAAGMPGGMRRVRHAHRALRALLLGQPLCLEDVRDVAFLLALANREARLYGPGGQRIVRSTAHAVDGLDRLAVRRSLEPARNSFRVRPDRALLSALARVSGRLGYQVGVEALRAKLTALGVGEPVIQSVERELNREGLTLGDLSQPAMAGSFGALTPEALAGRWLADQL